MLLRTALITSSILKPFPCRRIVCDVPHPWSSTEWWPRHFLLRHSQTQLSLPRYKSAGTAEYQAEHVLLQNIKHYIMFNNKLFWPHALLNDEFISPQSHQLSSSKFSVSNPRYTKYKLRKYELQWLTFIILIFSLKSEVCLKLCTCINLVRIWVENCSRWMWGLAKSSLKFSHQSTQFMIQLLETKVHEFEFKTRNWGWVETWGKLMTGGPMS